MKNKLIIVTKESNRMAFRSLRKAVLEINKVAGPKLSIATLKALKYPFESKGYHFQRKQIKYTIRKTVILEDNTVEIIID
jgi:hypothetical protein